jgi:hypothetical protein
MLLRHSNGRHESCWQSNEQTTGVQERHAHGGFKSGTTEARGARNRSHEGSVVASLAGTLTPKAGRTLAPCQGQPARLRLAGASAFLFAPVQFVEQRVSRRDQVVCGREIVRRLACATEQGNEDLLALGLGKSLEIRPASFERSPS